jgi:hypothetical protein
LQSLTLCLLCRHDRGLAQRLHASCWPCLSSHRKAPSAGGTCYCFCSALHLTRSSTSKPPFSVPCLPRPSGVCHTCVPVSFLCTHCPLLRGHVPVSLLLHLSPTCSALHVCMFMGSFMLRQRTAIGNALWACFQGCLEGQTSRLM